MNITLFLLSWIVPGIISFIYLSEKYWHLEKSTIFCLRNTKEMVFVVFFIVFFILICWNLEERE